MNYPCWRYHREHPPKIIYSAEEESPAWENNYAKVGLIALERDGHMVFDKIPAEAPKEAADSYKEHMEKWESKEEKKKPGRPKKAVS